jgi:N-acyl-D-amino-acid deacylase
MVSSSIQGRTIPSLRPTALFLLPALLPISCSPADGPDPLSGDQADVLFTGGTLFDGSGGESFRADLGIRNGRILFLGESGAEGFTAGDTIDVSGLWVAPGFIDAHSHAALDEDYGRDGLPYLYQGITTVVLGIDGGGNNEINQHFRFWEESGIGLNGLLYVGHGAARREVMGTEARAPTLDEMEAMKAYVSKGMQEGALGLSTGLFYVPGTYATTEEVIEIARVAAEWEGAIYDTHDRDLGAVYQGVGYDASVQEAIRIGEESGLRVVFSHYNLQGAHNDGRGDVGARLVNDARARGVGVWAAHHPYTATQSNLRSYTVPDWAAAGGWEEMIRRFDNPDSLALINEQTLAMLEIRGGPEKLLFADPRPELNGKTLAQVAEEWGMSAPEAAREILRAGNAAVMNLDLYDHQNTRILAQEQWMMTCTDGRTPRPDQVITHPRTYGAFPRKMRLFVFEEHLLSPEFVIRSFSGLAADFLRLPDRGYLREGYQADVTIIDPERYTDLATFEDPRRYSEGVMHVLVNGVFAIRDGVPTGVLAGVPIPRPW